MWSDGHVSIEETEEKREAEEEERSKRKLQLFVQLSSSGCKPTGACECVCLCVCQPCCMHDSDLTYLCHPKPLQCLNHEGTSESDGSVEACSVTRMMLEVPLDS